MLVFVLHRQRSAIVRQNSGEINHEYGMIEIVFPSNNLFEIEFHDAKLSVKSSNELTQEISNSIERTLLK